MQSNVINSNCNSICKFYRHLFKLFLLSSDFLQIHNQSLMTDENWITKSGKTTGDTRNLASKISVSVWRIHLLHIGTSSKSFSFCSLVLISFLRKPSTMFIFSSPVEHLCYQYAISLIQTSNSKQTSIVNTKILRQALMSSSSNPIQLFSSYTHTCCGQRQGSYCTPSRQGKSCRCCWRRMARFATWDTNLLHIT